MSSKLLLEKDRSWAGEKAAVLVCYVCDVRESLESFATLSLLIHLSEEKALEAWGMGGCSSKRENEVCTVRWLSLSVAGGESLVWNRHGECHVGAVFPNYTAPVPVGM